MTRERPIIRFLMLALMCASALAARAAGEVELPVFLMGKDSWLAGPIVKVGFRGQAHEAVELTDAAKKGKVYYILSSKILLFDSVDMGMDDDRMIVASMDTKEVILWFKGKNTFKGSRLVETQGGVRLVGEDVASTSVYADCEVPVMTDGDVVLAAMGWGNSERAGFTIYSRSKKNNRCALQIDTVEGILRSKGMAVVGFKNIQTIRCGIACSTDDDHTFYYDKSAQHFVQHNTYVSQVTITFQKPYYRLVTVTADADAKCYVSQSARESGSNQPAAKALPPGTASRQSATPSRSGSARARASASSKPSGGSRTYIRKRSK